MLLKLQEAANYIESPDRETILDPNLQATLWGSSSHCHPGQRKAGFGFISSPLPSSFRALAYQPHQDRREEEGWRRDGFLVLNLWKLPGRDWRGGDWELVPPKYICWPPLVTLEKRWFWVFSSIFVSPTKLLGFSGEGFGGHHKKTVQQFLAGSREHLWDSHHLGKSKGGRKLHRFSCKPFPILSPLPTIFPQRSGQSPEKKSMLLNRKKKKENKKKKMCESTCKRSKGNRKDDTGKRGPSCQEGKRAARSHPLDDNRGHWQDGFQSKMPPNHKRNITAFRETELPFCPRIEHAWKSINPTFLIFNF